MAIIHVKDETFEQEIQTEGKVLVDFYADWCGPCRALAPILEELDNDREQIKIIKVNVDQCPKVAQKYGVMSIPTLIVMENSKEIHKKIGLCSKEEILDMIHQ